MGVLLTPRARELAIIAGAAAYFALAPALPEFPLCVVHTLSGVHCPTCGTTRALFALMHGDAAAAWKYNPVVFVLVAAVMRRVAMLTSERSAKVLGREPISVTLLVSFFALGLMTFLQRNGLLA